VASASGNHASSIDFTSGNLSLRDLLLRVHNIKKSSIQVVFVQNQLYAARNTGGHEGCWTETQITPLKINPLGQSGGCSVIQTVPFSLVPGGQISVPGKTHSFPLKLVPAGQHFTSLDPLSWDGNISFRVMLRLSSAGVDSAAAALRFPIAMGSNPLSTPRIPGPTLLLSAAA
jgi:hypothetical protein